MEYIKSKINKTVRHVIFITFVVIFLILTPAIILYTEGYRYDWDNGLLREMGAISIDTTPTNATVFLDGLKIQQGLPIRLKNVSPRKYHIKISATGYYDWERDFEVKNKQTVYIKEIGLIKKEDPSTLVTGDVQTIALSSDNKYLAYILLNGKKTEVHLLNLSDSNNQMLMELPTEAKYEITWAKKNNYFSITDTATPHQSLWVFEAGTDKKINLNTLVGKPIYKYEWKDNTEPELFFSTKTTLFTIRPATQNIYQITSSTIIDWRAEQGQFWTLKTVSTSNQIAVVKDSFGFKNNFAILDSITHPEITSTNPNLRIVEASGNRVLIKFNDKDSLIFINNGKTYNLVGNNFTISPFYEWLIMWTPWELWTHTANEDPYLLNRSGEGLRKVIPLDQHNTLALIWNNKTTILYPYYQVTHNFIDSPVVDAAADTNNQIIYFISTIDKKTGIWKINY